MNKTITMLAMATIVAAMTASADVIFTDDFESDAASAPANDTLYAEWFFDNTIAGDANSITEENEHRIFASGAGGGGFQSQGWISSYSNAFIYVDLGLAVANTNYTAIALIDAETSVASSTVNYQMDLLLGDSYGTAISVAQISGSESGGTDGKQPSEFKRLDYISGAVSETDHLFLQITRTGGSPFIYVDDVSVEIVEEFVPQILSFTASPEAVVSNETSTLSWATLYADALTLEPGSINVTGLTSTDVVITTNITYSLIATSASGSVTNTVDITSLPPEPDVTMLWRRDWEQLGHNAEVDNNNLDGGPVSAVEVGTQDFTLSGGTLRTFDSASVGGFDLISTVNVDPFDAIIEITDVQYAAGIEHTLEFVIGTGASSGLNGAWIVEYGTMSDGTFTVLPSVDAGTATYSFDTAADGPLNADENFQDNTNFSALFGYNVGGRIQTLVVDAPDTVNGQNVAVRIVVTASENWAGYTDMALYSTSDPLEPVGEISISNLASGDVAITWDTASGQAYDVQTNANLVVPNWGTMDSVIGNGGSITVTSATDQVELFYQVISQ